MLSIHSACSLCKLLWARCFSAQYQKIWQKRKHSRILQTGLPLHIFWMLSYTTDILKVRKNHRLRFEREHIYCQHQGREVWSQSKEELEVLNEAQQVWILSWISCFHDLQFKFKSFLNFFALRSSFFGDQNLKLVTPIWFWLSTLLSLYITVICALATKHQLWEETYKWFSTSCQACKSNSMKRNLSGSWRRLMSNHRLCMRSPHYWNLS